MNHIRILWVSFAVLILDLITKYIVKFTMHLHQSIPVIGDFFRLTYVENEGMAFGLHFGHTSFFTVFAIAASVAIIIYLFKMKGDHLLARLAMAIIFGGAVGNLSGRLFRGRVIDFLDFEFFDINIPAFKLLFVDFPGYNLDRWPVFNVADIAVTVGMMILLVFIVFENQEENKKLLKEEADSPIIH
jgi:signal peptidase II